MQMLNSYNKHIASVVYNACCYFTVVAFIVARILKKKCACIACTCTNKTARTHCYIEGA